MERSRKIGLLKSLYSAKKAFGAEIAKHNGESISKAFAYFERNEIDPINFVHNHTGLSEDTEKLVELFDSLYLAKDLISYLLSCHDKKSRGIYYAQIRDKSRKVKKYEKHWSGRLIKLCAENMSLREVAGFMDGDYLYFSALCNSEKGLKEMAKKEGLSYEKLVMAYKQRQAIRLSDIKVHKNLW